MTQHDSNSPAGRASTGRGPLCSAGSLSFAGWSRYEIERRWPPQKKQNPPAGVAHLLVTARNDLRSPAVPPSLWYVPLWLSQHRRSPSLRRSPLPTRDHHQDCQFRPGRTRCTSSTYRSLVRYHLLPPDGRTMLSRCKLRVTSSSCSRVKTGSVPGRCATEIRLSLLLYVRRT